MTTALVKRGAGGRPPLARKGDVEERLLAAATRLFLAHGYEGTSCDQVAVDAHAGKASIYARYANKTALLQAVVDANLRRMFDMVEESEVMDAPLRERVAHAGETVIGKVFQPEAIALLRLIVSEAPRLQGAALDAHAILQRIGAEHVAGAICMRAREDSGKGVDAVSVQAAVEPALALLDAALMPGLVRALLGAEPPALRVQASTALVAALDRMIDGGALARWE